MSDTFQTQFQQRAQRLTAESQALWQELAREYSLDLQREVYALSADGKSLVLRAVNYAG